MSENDDRETDERPAPTIDLTHLDERLLHQFDGISDTRKQDLKKRFWAWKPKEVNVYPGPFEGEHFDGLEVRWLVEEARQRMQDQFDPDPIFWERFPLPLMGVSLLDADLAGIELPEAHLECAVLGRANLKGADLSGARLNGSNLRKANLENAKLDGADLTGSVLYKAHLEGTRVSGAHLKNADLYGAHLQAANLSGADLVSVDLSKAHLEGANLEGANLAGADLRGASLNKLTKLGGAVLSGVYLDQAVIDDTDFTAVELDLLPTLGDEVEARKARGQVTNRYDGFDDNRYTAPGATSAQKRTVEYAPKSRGTRAADYAAATRAYRILTSALRSQGLGEDADHYAYQAQKMRCKQLWYQRRLFKYLWMRFLSLSVGYGYRPWRIVTTYAVVVSLFSVGFLFAGMLDGRTLLTWQTLADAIQISLNAIHGRVFFVQFNLDTLQSWMATLESVIGIVIEGVFVAALIQRLFSR